MTDAISSRHACVFLWQRTLPFIRHERDSLFFTRVCCSPPCVSTEDRLPPQPLPRAPMSYKYSSHADESMHVLWCSCEQSLCNMYVCMYVCMIT